MLLGTAAINGAALAGIMFTAFRRGGPVLLGFVAVGVAALVRSVGAGTLYDPFNSEIATYALLLTVLAAWSVAAGDRRLLPLLTASATLAARPTCPAPWRWRPWSASPSGSWWCRRAPDAGRRLGSSAGWARPQR